MPQLPLALLIDTLDDEYQVAVLKGAISATRDLGIGLLCVAGGRVRDVARERAARNAAFDLVNNETVSGVVALTSVLGSAIGPDELGLWLDRFRQIPLCCVGVPIKGQVPIEVDNAGGMRELVLHLIREHGRRRIGFIQGPSGSAEARMRFQAYRSAIEASELPFDPQLVVEGDFLKSSGVTAVRALLERHRPRTEFDALVAANDYMALGAMQELWRQRVEIPEDIAVVGFDDVESARFARPGLTTASQPTEQIGRYGVESAFGMTQGRGVQSASLATKMVLRGSCGCRSAVAGLASSIGSAAGAGVQTSFMQRRQAILAELVRAAAGRLGVVGAGWEARLLDGLLGDLRGGGGMSVCRAIEQVLQKLERMPVPGVVLQDVLTALRRQSLPCVVGAPAARDQLEDSLHEARILVGAFSEHVGERRARLARERSRAFESALRAARITDTARLSQVASEILPELGVEACVVATLNQPDDVAGKAQLLFGFAARERIQNPSDTWCKRLTLHPLLEHAGRVLLALPLVASGHTIGMAAMAMARLPDDELEPLREMLGTTLEMLRYKSQEERRAESR